jgi:hypothetical protein
VLFYERADELGDFFLLTPGQFGRGFKDVLQPKGVSPEYLHKSGYGLGFCPVNAIAD